MIALHKTDAYTICFLDKEENMHRTVLQLMPAALHKFAAQLMSNVQEDIQLFSLYL